MEATRRFCAVQFVSIVAAVTALHFGLKWEITDPDTSIMFLKLFITFCYIETFFVWFAFFGKDIVGNLRPGQSLLTAAVSVVIRMLSFTFGGSLFFHVIAILYGAPLSKNFEETFLWSLLVCGLSIFPLALVARCQWSNFIEIFQQRWRMSHTMEDCFKCICFMVLFGCWAGAFVIPLDWDRPWQVWPIPCALGALAGHLIGLVACFLISSLKPIGGLQYRKTM